MSEHRIKTIDFDQFQAVADRFIECSSSEFGEMSASSFFELLFEKIVERVTETIELEGEVVDNQLVLRLPAELETAVHVKNNDILVGNRRIVVKLKDGIVYPKVH